jgi:hypothetical protein
MTRDEAKVVAYALATLAAHLRHGAGWTDECALAYAGARDALQRDATATRMEATRATRYAAVDPAEPCTWPAGACRFAKL